MSVKIELLKTPSKAVCEFAARMCYGAKDGTKALLAAIDSGHESLLEHETFSFHVSGVSRVLLAQLTRHRIASYSVRSQRYCGATLDYVIPKTIYEDEELSADLYKVLNVAEAFYLKATRKGVPDEDARYFTFQAGLTELVVTMNIRELRHFLSLRCCRRAQWEIREMADEMLRQAREVLPEFFRDAGPGCVRGRCPEGKKSCGEPRKELMV